MKFNIWLIALLLIFALVFFLSLRKIYDTDIGFHLRGGEWMLENKSFHRFDQFTYTVPQNEYIALYWLFQVIIFIIFKSLGDGALTIFNSILILTIFFILYLRLKKASIPLWLICILILASIFPFELRFGVRPEIFTYIFMVMMLYLLDLFYFHKKNYLFLLPFIQLLWVNFHGLFILGWVIMVCYLISVFFYDKSAFNKLLKWTILAILISALNPYNIKGILFPFYLFTRLQSSSVFKNAITEFASPFSARGFLLTSPTALFGYFIFLGLSILFLIITRKKIKIHEYLLFIAFGYLSATAVRNIPLFIIISIQILGLGISNVIPIIKKFLYIRKIADYTFATFIVIFTSFFIVWIINNGFYASRGGGSFGIGFDLVVQPIKACEFINEHNLKGRILNDLNRGSWLIWAVREPVYIDGRLEVIKEGLFTEFHNSHQPGGIIELINKYQPTIIIFDYSYPEALFWDIDLENSTDWRLIYWDETSVIYAKKGYAEDLKSVSFFTTIQQLGINTELQEYHKWQILRTPTKSFLKLFFEGLFKKQQYPVALLRMAFYAALKLDFATAEILYLNALKNADYHRAEIYFHLGLIYHFMQHFDKAEYCYKKVLIEKPGHKKTKEMLSRLQQGLLPTN